MRDIYDQNKDLCSSKNKQIALEYINQNQIQDSTHINYNLSHL